MGFFSRFLPKRKPVEIKNNIPKEKAHIKKVFTIYCHKRHGTDKDKLCAKCSALLATVYTKMTRCPYGITKPICDRCDRICFGKKESQEFLSIMNSSGVAMWMRHPIMALKHKLMSMGVDYAKYRQEKNIADKAKAKEKAAKDKEKKK